MESGDLIIKTADNKELLVSARRLFMAYAESLDFNLCFQNFEKEVSNLPGDYSDAEGGRLLLLFSGGEAAGCVALRKVTPEISEMKRLFILPEYRGRGWGRMLVMEIIGQAKRIGYARMKLDTVPTMKEAIGLYREIGFREVSSYRYNPVAGAIYMELGLEPRGAS